MIEGAEKQADGLEQGWLQCAPSGFRLPVDNHEQVWAGCVCVCALVYSAKARLSLSKDTPHTPVHDCTQAAP